MPTAYNSATPAGTVMPFAGGTIPSGYLYCDGSAVSRTTYANLFNKIGISCGSGDGSTTFNLPDYRGRFHRGVDGGTGRDPDAASRASMNTGGNSANAVGSTQASAVSNHYHLVPIDKAGTTGSWGQTQTSAADSGTAVSISYAGYIAYPGNPLPSTGNTQLITGQSLSYASLSYETRAINAYVFYMVKY